MRARRTTASGDDGVTRNGGPVDLRGLLKDATAAEAQLALSLIVWPSQAPDPRVVDEWVRRLHAYSTPKHSETAPRSHTGHLPGIVPKPA